MVTVKEVVGDVGLKRGRLYVIASMERPIRETAMMMRLLEIALP